MIIVGKLTPSYDHQNGKYVLCIQLPDNSMLPVLLVDEKLCLLFEIEYIENGNDRVICELEARLIAVSEQLLDRARLINYQAVFENEIVILIVTDMYIERGT